MQATIQLLLKEHLSVETDEKLKENILKILTIIR